VTTLSADELETPYWLLTDEPSDRRLPRLLRDGLRPLANIVRRAAPGAALTIAVLQVAYGAVTAAALLATTAAFAAVLAAGTGAGTGFAAMVTAGALVALLYATRGAIETGVGLAQARLLPAVRRVAGETLFGSTLRVELSAFDDPAFYDRMHRARDRGLARIDQGLQDTVTLISSAVAVVAAAGSLGVLHPVLLPVLLIGVLAQGWATLRAARFGYTSANRTISLRRRQWMIADLATAREAAPEIRACQAEPFVLGEYRQIAGTLRDHETAVGRAQAKTLAIGRATAGIGIIATFALLGVLVHAGWVELAVAGAAVIAIRTATTALTQLVLAANQLADHALYIADYQIFLADTATRARPVTGRPAPVAPNRITLHDVGFNYPNAQHGRPALRELNLTIHAGQTVALVGENGSGKTTLAKLIAGLYRPTTGRITWDGVDVDEIDPASLADRVVMVQQEPVRWPHTARANVRIGRHDVADPDGSRLRNAAAEANADEVIDGLPRRWDTLLSTSFRGGHDLSGGQWQRLAVARGLYRDARLLIWDEPTAPLDAKAEYAVYESLRRMAGDHTVILITHRLASVRHADRIYLLHEGRIAEQGTHSELLATGGRYAQLTELQARLQPTRL
jgi:ATP-binding cassette, subfamily B, bacterial